MENYIVAPGKRFLNRHVLQAVDWINAQTKILLYAFLFSVGCLDCKGKNRNHINLPLYIYILKSGEIEIIVIIDEPKA